jgi:hypothetical protein
MLHAKSSRLNFLFESYKTSVQSLQQKFEELWISIESFPLSEAKAAIRDLRMRSSDFLLSAHTEIFVEKKKSKSSKKSTTHTVNGSPNRSPNRTSQSPIKKKLSNNNINSSFFSSEELDEIYSTVFGDAFGTSSGLPYNYPTSQKSIIRGFDINESVLHKEIREDCVLEERTQLDTEPMEVEHNKRSRL